MRAISVRHPWAWALLHGKPVENRSKPWPLGEYALHASKLPARENVPWDLIDEMWSVRSMAERSGIALPLPITYADMVAMSGAIIGVIEVVDCVTSHPSPFYCGPYGLVINQQTVIALPKPVPCRGALGAWTVPPEVERAVREQLGGSHVG